MTSALYIGSVMHRRIKPRQHLLRYRVFWMLLDLDEMPKLSRGLRLFSRNRFNLFSFHDRDHGDGRTVPLRAYVERELALRDVDFHGGRIELLCMPRILGYVFNPISIYFCYRRDNSLAALLYEVRNTFGEKHSYLIPVSGNSGVVRQNCAKEFYVSPFMDMELTYEFRVAFPGKRVSVVIGCSDARGQMLVASLAGRRHALTDRKLAAIFLSHPLLTLKVMGAIHWEAVKLLIKGIRIRTRPPVPEHAVSYISPERVQDRV
jgi:DUF1365 family protein